MGVSVIDVQRHSNLCLSQMVVDVVLIYFSLQSWWILSRAPHQEKCVLDIQAWIGGMLTSSTQQWKVFVLDEGSKRLIDNVVTMDEILNENVTST